MTMLALSTLGASAAIVCSGNVCWHAQESYDYPPTHEAATRWRPFPFGGFAHTAIKIGAFVGGKITSLLYPPKKLDPLGGCIFTHQDKHKHKAPPQLTNNMGEPKRNR